MDLLELLRKAIKEKNAKRVQELLTAHKLDYDIESLIKLNEESVMSPDIQVIVLNHIKEATPSQENKRRNRLG